MRKYLVIALPCLIIILFTIFLISSFSKTSKIVGTVHYKNVFGFHLATKQIVTYPLAAFLLVTLIIIIAIIAQKTKTHIRIKNFYFRKNIFRKKNIVVIGKQT